MLVPRSRAPQSPAEDGGVHTLLAVGNHDVYELCETLGQADTSRY